MSVLFVFECVSEQRRGAYCNFLSWKWCLLCLEPGRFAGDFPVKSLAAGGTWPHGVTFSRSAEICPYGKPLKKPNCKIVAKSVPLNTMGCFFLPTWAHFLSWVAEEVEGERGCACSFQVLSQWPGDAWHPSALGLALGSSEPGKTGRGVSVVSRILSVIKMKLKRFVISHRLLLLPGCMAANC